MAEMQVRARANGTGLLAEKQNWRQLWLALVALVTAAAEEASGGSDTRSSGDGCTESFRARRGGENAECLFG